MFFSRSRCSTTFLEGVINRISSKSALQSQSLTRKIFKLSSPQVTSDFLRHKCDHQYQDQGLAVLAISIVFPRKLFRLSINNWISGRAHSWPDWTSNSLSFIDFSFAAFEHETFKIRSQEIRKVEVSATGAQNITVSFLLIFSTRTQTFPFALRYCF